jgi:type IV pilus assembly protein PilN
MRIALNLSSRPWTDQGPLIRKLRIAVIAMVLLAALLVGAERVAHRRAMIAAKNESVIANQEAALQKERTMYQSQLQEPKNAAVLIRSRFLNRIFAEKSFSWTAVMMDLENVMPAGVQVAQIQPQVMPDGTIVIQMRVNGERDKAVDLIRALEHSQRFLSPRLAGEATQSTQGSNGVQPVASGPVPVTFDIQAEYNPLPAPTTEQLEKHLAERNAEAAKKKGPAPTHPPVGPAGGRGQGPIHPMGSPQSRPMPLSKRPTP